MRRLLFILALAGGALLGAVALGGCPEGDSVEKGCKTRQDCPRPDRQICDLETGLCVGFTSQPGQVDGGDGEGVDAGLADSGT